VQVPASTPAPLSAFPATSKTCSCVAPPASTQPFTIWMRCRSTPGRAAVPGSFIAHTAKRGLLLPRTAPSSPPIAVPVA
jgi:hypothetical protein